KLGCYLSTHTQPLPSHLSHFSSCFLHSCVLSVGNGSAQEYSLGTHTNTIRNTLPVPLHSRSGHRIFVPRLSVMIFCSSSSRTAASCGSLTPTPTAIRPTAPIPRAAFSQKVSSLECACCFNVASTMLV